MVSHAIRERYLRDPWSIRLGGLAADLARIASAAGNQQNRDAVVSLLEEGKFFAEWTAPDAPAGVQTALAEIQVMLALWHRRWLAGHHPPRMQAEARQWSEKLLELSGLL